MPRRKAVAGEPLPRLGYSVAELAESLGTTKGWVYSQIYSGELAVYRAGGIIRISPEAIDALLRRAAKRPPAPPRRRPVPPDLDPAR